VIFVAGTDNGTTGHSFLGPVRRCKRENGYVFIRGERFELRLKERGIGQIRLIERHRGEGRTHTTVELHSPDGTLIVRIGGVSDPVAAAVWQDLMDSFTVSTSWTVPAGGNPE
jgi:putative heme degradation protein